MTMWASPYPALILDHRAKQKTCVIGDLHLGLETSFLRASPLFSSFLSEETVRNVGNLTRDHDVRRLIILGDVKHSIRSFTPQERRLTRTLFQQLQESNVRVEIVRGNHDFGIESATRQFSNIHMASEADVIVEVEGRESVMITHGHRKIRPEALEEADQLIVGHIHPCVRLTHEMPEPMILRACLEFMASFDHHGKLMKRVTVLPAFTSLGCYLFSHTEIRKRLPTLRPLEFDTKEIMVFDLAHNFLGTLGDLQATG